MKWVDSVDSMMFKVFPSLCNNPEPGRVRDVQEKVIHTWLADLARLNSETIDQLA